MLFEGKILDGRHRYRACTEQGVAPRFRDYTGTDAAGFVASENAARRHLSVSQLALAGAKLADVEMARAKARQLQSLKRGDEAPSQSPDRDGECGNTSEIIGQKFGIGEKTVRRGINVVKRGAPEVVKAVESNMMSINEAQPLPNTTCNNTGREIATPDSTVPGGGLGGRRRPCRVYLIEGQNRYH